MSLIDASEDSTPSTAPIETFIDGEDSAREIRSASTPLSLSAARALAPEGEEGDQRREDFEAKREPRHQKACPMLT